MDPGVRKILQYTFSKMEYVLNDIKKRPEGLHSFDYFEISKPILILAYSRKFLSEFEKIGITSGLDSGLF